MIAEEAFEDIAEKWLKTRSKVGGNLRRSIGFSRQVCVTR